MTPDREAQHQVRENILAAAAIRAMFCASRGLPPSSACRLAQPERSPAPSGDRPVEADSEGGEI